MCLHARVHTHSCLAVATRTGFRILNTQVCDASRIRACHLSHRGVFGCSVKRSHETRLARSPAPVQTGDCVYEERVGAVR